jgi:hypothetical protein
MSATGQRGRSRRSKSGYRVGDVHRRRSVGRRGEAFQRCVIVLGEWVEALLQKVVHKFGLREANEHGGTKEGRYGRRFGV